jgi:hypothetical protein
MKAWNLVCFHRSSSNKGEDSQLNSFSSYSKHSGIPNNVLEEITHNISRRNSSPARTVAKERSSSRNSSTLLDTYSKHHKCQTCDSSSYERRKSHEISGMIITVKPSSNSKTHSYPTPKSWPKVLLRAAKKSTAVSEDESQVAEPCLSNRQLLNQQETCM